MVGSLGLRLGTPRTAADVGERAVAEVSPENLSETRVTAVTGWWGSRNERLTGRGFGGSGAGKVWAVSGSPSPRPGTCDHGGRGQVSQASKPTQTPQEHSSLPAPPLSPPPGRPP